MKQKKICRWLKGLTVLLGTMGVAFFGGVTVLAFYMRQQNPQDPVWSFVFFSWYTAVLCYGVLFQFWNVCTQIGRDNSFSVKNAVSLRNIALLAAFDAAFFFAGNILFLFLNMNHPAVVLASCFVTFLGVAVAVAAACLSHLVYKAAKLREENDLTI